MDGANDGTFLNRQLMAQVHDLPALLRVEATRRLVEHNDCRVLEESTPD